MINFRYVITVKSFSYCMSTFSQYCLVICRLPFFNPSRPKSDQHQISPYNNIIYICMLSKTVTKIKDMITQHIMSVDTSTASPLHLRRKHIGAPNENLNFDIRG